MNRPAFLAAACCLALAAAPIDVPAAEPGPLVLTGATVFDGTGAAPLPNAAVVIEGDRIVAVGPALSIRVPANARTMNVAGRFIVPGLIDAHVHFFQSGGLYTRPDVIDLRAIRPYAAEQEQIRASLDGTFRRYLASGVTAVVDVGGPFWNFEVRDRALHDRYAPHVAVAGPLISTVARPQLDLGDPPIVKVDSPAEARALVEKQLAKKPDLVKIWYIVTPERPPEASREIVRATIQAAHAAHVRVAVHATELEAARIAVAEGADILVHSVTDKPVDSAFTELLKSRRTIYITTLTVFRRYPEVLGETVQPMEIERRLGDPAVLETWPEMAAFREVLGGRVQARFERARREIPIANANLLALHQAGVTIAAGTDAGNIGTLHGPSIHREFALMREAGMSPRDILLAATRDAARVFAETPSFGTLVLGHVADLLVLEADPLADIANLQRIRYVVKCGEVLDPGELLPASPEVVVDRQIAAWRARNVDAFVAAYAPGATVTHARDGRLIAGRDALRAAYAPNFAAEPGAVLTIVKRTVSGPFVVDQEFIDPKTGQPPRRALAVYEVRDGLIQRAWLFRNDSP